MTRVLLLHQPVDGGVGRHVHDVAAGLPALGYEVITCGPERLPGLPSDVRHVHLDLVRAVAPIGDAACLSRWARIVAEVKPDLIHAHSSKAGAIARLARAVHPRIPVLYTPHGYAFAGYFTSPSARLAYRGLEQLLTPLTTAVICVCEAEARLARSVGRNVRVRVVHNGVDAEPAAVPDPRLVELSHQGPVLGALTLLRPGKGLETLIDALPLVLTRHPHAQLAIFGGGPELTVLQARAKGHGIERAVHFLGPTSDALSALSGLDLFVHPSWAESFPYAVLEAMSVGKPIVATDVGGVGEAVVDGVCGRLVAPRDERALADGCNAILDDDAQSREMGAAAQVRLKDRFSTAEMVKCQAAVYDELSVPFKTLGHPSAV